MWAKKLSFLYINSVKGWLCSPLWHYIMIVFCDDEGRCLLCEAKPVLFDIRYERERGDVVALAMATQTNMKVKSGESHNDLNDFPSREINNFYVKSKESGPLAVEYFSFASSE